MAITALALTANWSSSISSSPILTEMLSWFFVLTRTEFLKRSTIASIGAPYGNGVGILPLGPRNCPNERPTVGINAVSERKKLYALEIFRASLLLVPILSSSSGSITLSIPARCALVPMSPDATAQIVAGWLGLCGNDTISLKLNPFLTSISFNTNVNSTDCLKLRLGAASLALFTSKLSCLLIGMTYSNFLESRRHLKLLASDVYFGIRCSYSRLSE